MRLENHFERVITFRPPAHVVRHPCKVVWFIHHVRYLYDLWDSEHRPFADLAPHRALRDTVVRADTAALKEARHLFTNSRVVSDRVRRFNGLESEVLYPPVLRPELFAAGEYGNEIVSVCRVERHKRQHLLIEAMRHVRTPVRLRLCGTGLDTNYMQSLRRLAEESGAADRIAIEDAWITEEEKAARLEGALASAYVPYDEDFYGYPTIEAAHARRCTVTVPTPAAWRNSSGTAKPASPQRRSRPSSPPPSTGSTPTAPSRAALATTRPCGSRNSASTGIRWSRSCSHEGPGPQQHGPLRAGRCGGAVRPPGPQPQLRRGVEAEAMRIPFTWEPAEGVVEEMLITRSLSIWNVDRLIPLKFPAYLAPHPNKVPWLLHQFRQAYDLFDAGQSNIAGQPARRRTADRMIRAADDQAFRESQRIFTLSPTGADRLRRYNGFDGRDPPAAAQRPGTLPRRRGGGLHPRQRPRRARQAAASAGRGDAPRAGTAAGDRRAAGPAGGRRTPPPLGRRERGRGPADPRSPLPPPRRAGASGERRHGRGLPALRRGFRRLRHHGGLPRRQAGAEHERTPAACWRSCATAKPARCASRRRKPSGPPCRRSSPSPPAPPASDAPPARCWTRAASLGPPRSRSCWHEPGRAAAHRLGGAVERPLGHRRLRFAWWSANSPRAGTTSPCSAPRRARCCACRRARRRARSCWLGDATPEALAPRPRRRHHQPRRPVRPARRGRCGACCASRPWRSSTMPSSPTSTSAGRRPRAVNPPTPTVLGAVYGDAEAEDGRTRDAAAWRRWRRGGPCSNGSPLSPPAPWCMRATTRSGCARSAPARWMSSRSPLKASRCRRRRGTSGGRWSWPRSASSTTTSGSPTCSAPWPNSAPLQERIRYRLVGPAEPAQQQALLDLAAIARRP